MTYDTSCIKPLDARRNVAIPGNAEATIHFATEQVIAIANEAINNQGFFTIALSGGSTPKSIYQSLACSENRERVDWPRVKLFWSDERNVMPDHPSSNYKMAMGSGLALLRIPPEHIFRMPAEGDLIAGAKEYEKTILREIPNGQFDLMMLGMGGDGHTASLFPDTEALEVSDHLVAANMVPQLNTNRMTLTFPCINRSRYIVIYVLGSSKAERVKEVLTTENVLPANRVGTSTSQAMWVLDKEAARLL